MRATWKGSGLRCLVLRQHTGQVQHGWAVDKEMRDRQVASVPSPGHPTHPQPTVFPSQASPLPSTLAHGPHELRLASFKAHLLLRPGHPRTCGHTASRYRLLPSQTPLPSTPHVLRVSTTHHLPRSSRVQRQGCREQVLYWLCAPCGCSCHSPTERST